MRLTLNKQWIIILLGVCFFSCFLIGCQGDNSNESNNTPSSKLLMKVNSVPSGMLNTDAVKVRQNGSITSLELKVPGGILEITYANISFKDLVIEENSGFDGEQDGENNNDNQNDGESESEAPDITAAGPFSVDLSSGSASLGSFDVYPGTFKKVNFQLVQNNVDLYSGKTISIKGTFTPDNGSPIPLTLNSDLAAHLQLPLANGGISVIENSSASINIVIDLPGLFNNLDLSSAQVGNGEIIIDAQNNPALLNEFESNLKAHIDAEDGENGD